MYFSGRVIGQILCDTSFIRVRPKESVSSAVETSLRRNQATSSFLTWTSIFYSTLDNSVTLHQNINYCKIFRIKSVTAANCTKRTLLELVDKN